MDFQKNSRWVNCLNYFRKCSLHLNKQSLEIQGVLRLWRCHLRVLALPLVRKISGCQILTTLITEFCLWSTALLLLNFLVQGGGHFAQNCILLQYGSHYPQETTEH